jgi:hypothetical protein
MYPVVENGIAYLWDIKNKVLYIKQRSNILLKIIENGRKT